MNKLDKMIAKIDTCKETFAALPKNNKKNLTAYMNKLKDLSKDYNELKDELLQSMEKRYSKFSKYMDDENIEKIENNIEKYEEKINIANEYTTGFEKMNLDKAINDLNHYYINDLKVVNDSIMFILKKFIEVGIDLKREEFFYNKYVMEYISLFFDAISSKKIADKEISSKFEEIYWKCPDIIIYIELNFRYLYIKYEKTINQYYAKQKSKLLNEITYQKLVDKYYDLKKEYIQEIKSNKYLITKEFIDGKLNPKDYEDETISKLYMQFLKNQSIEEYTKEEQNDIDDNLFKLINSVHEYKCYLRFKFIIDDIIKIYNDKEKIKNSFKDKKKEIIKNEIKIVKLSKKINFKNIFNNKHDKEISERNKIILGTKEMYKDLDDYRVYDAVINKLDDSSTISDVIHLASSFYIYLFHLIRKQYTEEYSQQDIEDLISDLRKFDSWPYKTFLRNLTITDQKDIVFIIKDRYQLLNINVKKEDLQEDNLDNLIETIHKIQIAYCIRKNKMDLNEIKSEIEFKKYIDQNM